MAKKNREKEQTLREINKCRISRKKKEEQALQEAVVEYLLWKHPDVLFRSDLAGIKLPIGQAVKLKKLQKPGIKWPDLIIYEKSGEHIGLALELKKNYSEIYLKTGELSQKKHIQEQVRSLEIFRSKGYAAYFVCGFDEAIGVIERYLTH